MLPIQESYGVKLMADKSAGRSVIKGMGLPLMGNDIDTDRIIPARFMKCVTFDGLGAYAFFDERYDVNGDQKDHIMNDERYAEGSILLVNKNFGCGSSREHAPQALYHWGIRGFVGESFAEIFAGNCNSLGLPAVRVSREAIGKLMEICMANPSPVLTIDLKEGYVSAEGTAFPASLPEGYRRALIEGTWDVTQTLLEGSGEVDRKYRELPYLRGFT